MAVTRYAWTCPGCGRQFAVRDGLAPALCPGCQAAAGSEPSEAPPDPEDVVLHMGSPPALPRARPRTLAVLLQWAFDPGFERYLTLSLVRAAWLAVLLSAATAVLAGTALLATGRWSPGPSPASISAGLWNFVSWLSLVAGTALAVCVARVFCEGVIVLFQMARALDALRQAEEERRNKPGTD